MNSTLTNIKTTPTTNWKDLKKGIDILNKQKKAEMKLGLEIIVWVANKLGYVFSEVKTSYYPELKNKDKYFIMYKKK